MALASLAGKLHGMAVVTRLAEAEVKDLHDYFGGGLTARPVDRVVLCAESPGASQLPPYADGDQVFKNAPSAARQSFNVLSQDAASLYPGRLVQPDSALPGCAAMCNHL